MPPPPRIVVLDAHALNPGDLSWESLESLGELEVHARTAPSEVSARARSAALVLTNKTPLSRELLEGLVELRYVGVLATGTNVVDVLAARDRGVVVTNVPSYGAGSVAEHALAMMLDSVRHLSGHIRAVREGAWARCPDFSFSVAPIGALSERTLGIVGYGAIGRRVAELARAFRMHVLIGEHPGLNAGSFEVCSVDELFRRSDIVSLHCPLSDSTRGLVNEARLGSMKAGATLVNTARGDLVDEPALVQALSSGRLGRAYLDVLSREPPPADHPLTSLDNCHVTPHCAWASVDARRELMRVATENVRAFLAGRPQNVVS